MKFRIKGGYFPVWGTCLGFEQLIVSSVDPTLRIRPNSSEYPIAECVGCRGIATTVQKSTGWNKSKFIKSLPHEIVHAMANGEAIGYSWHKKCIPTAALSHPSLQDWFQIENEM